jgi:hypothetical protein
MRVPSIPRKPSNVLDELLAASVDVAFAGLDKHAAEAILQDIDAQVQGYADVQPLQPHVKPTGDP